jgi:hypothetical protein
MRLLRKGISHGEGFLNHLSFALPLCDVLPASAKFVVRCSVDFTRSVVLIDIGTQVMRRNELDWMMAELASSTKPLVHNMPKSSSNFASPTTAERL